MGDVPDGRRCAVREPPGDDQQVVVRRVDVIDREVGGQELSVFAADLVECRRGDADRGALLEQPELGHDHFGVLELVSSQDERPDLAGARTRSNVMHVHGR